MNVFVAALDIHFLVSQKQLTLCSFTTDVFFDRYLWFNHQLSFTLWQKLL
jgi:hypothetical protein